MFNGDDAVIIGVHGSTLVLYPATRFAYADLTLARAIKKQTNLAKLLGDPAWNDLEKGVAKPALTKFKFMVNDPVLFEKFKTMHRVTGPMAKATHHVETCGA